MKLSIVVTFFLVLSVVAARPSGAQGFGYPNIYLTPYGCNELDVVVSDSNANDQGLANVELLFDSLGVFGHKIESYNVDFDGPQVDVQDGDLVGQFRIRVVDPLDTAYAAIWAINHTGRERLVEWHYKPAGLSRSPDVLTFDTVLMEQTGCAWARLLSSSDSSFLIDSVESSRLVHFTLGSKPQTPMRLARGDAFSVQVCYRALDTATVRDTLWVDLHGPVCFTRVAIPLEGHGLTPILYAGDATFMGVDTGATACSSVRVWNIGTAPVTVSPNPTNPPFAFASAASVTIPPNGFHDFTLCFSPHVYGTVRTDFTWSTNISPLALGFGKPASHITALAQPAGLHWDTTGGFYDPADGTADTIQFYVFNTSKNPLTLDSIQFVGTDARDFPIQGNAHAGETILPHDSIGVIIRFTPNLNKSTTYRLAAALIVSKGVAGDSLFLSGRTGQDAVKHSAREALSLSLFPNPVTGQVLHVSSPEEMPESVTLLNVLGAVLWTNGELNANEFDVPLHSLPGGEYFLRIAFSEQVVMRKFSVSR